jgi:hypothetical protein
MIFTNSNQYKNLKLTLDSIITDSAASGKSDLIHPKWMIQKKMADAYVEDQEVGGPGMLQVKPQGAGAAVSTIIEGYTKRYTATTKALHLHIAEEALDDSKYEQYINAAKRLTRSAYKTQDYEATQILILSTDASQLGGDAVALGSASHTLPSGATWSNLASSTFGYSTPSRSALIAGITATGLYKSQNGIEEGYQVEKIVCPLTQWASWEGIVKSTGVPESNANELNVVGPRGSMGGITVVPVKYWDSASTSAWGLITDVEGGLQFRQRKAVESRTWVDNDAMVMKYGVSYRSDAGWSDARAWYQGNT